MITATIFSLFGYDFFTNAIITAVLASISCGIVGTWVVAKRKVFIAGGITHSSFGGLGMGYFLGWDPLLGGILFGLLSAFGIELVAKKTEIREDSAIGIFWSLGMAVGIIFVFMTPGYAPNLMSYLFGSILTVTNSQIYQLLALSSVVVAFFMFYYRMILFVSFDEEYAASHKVPIRIFNFILMGLTALVIVFSIKVVGIILVISFLTIPQATASLISNQFRLVLIYSVLLAIAGSLSGLFISYLFDVPTGATIIFTFILFYASIKAVYSLIGLFRKKHIQVLH
ncbi:MAG TPA: metal ABC transporter permease [Bacteroidales bacterium]|nr:metal ABC transporter permease [Bacteroidales bacterium]